MMLLRIWHFIRRLTNSGPCPRCGSWNTGHDYLHHGCNDCQHFWYG